MYVALRQFIVRLKSFQVSFHSESEYRETTREDEKWIINIIRFSYIWTKVKMTDWLGFKKLYRINLFCFFFEWNLKIQFL